MQKMKVSYVEVKKGNEKRKYFLKIKQYTRKAKIRKNV